MKTLLLLITFLISSFSYANTKSEYFLSPDAGKMILTPKVAVTYSQLDTTNEVSKRELVRNVYSYNFDADFMYGISDDLFIGTGIVFGAHLNDFLGMDNFEVYDEWEIADIKLKVGGTKKLTDIFSVIYGLDFLWTPFSDNVKSAWGEDFYRGGDELVLTVGGLFHFERVKVGSAYLRDLYVEKEKFSNHEGSNFQLFVEFMASKDLTLAARWELLDNESFAGYPDIDMHKMGLLANYVFTQEFDLSLSYTFGSVDESNKIDNYRINGSDFDAVEIFGRLHF
jgi:hypothetical protein